MATDDFSPHTRLRDHPLGPVYCGDLPDGTGVAVRRIEAAVVEGQSDSDFEAVAASMARLQHAHVVPLQGLQPLPEVAVRRIEAALVEGQSDSDFEAVAANMARLQHAHVVPLQGYCMDGGELMLVFYPVPANIPSLFPSPCPRASCLPSSCLPSLCLPTHRSPNQEVAVRRIEAAIVEGQSDSDFEAVAANMARLQHAHVVPLQGYCVDGGERMLVFEHFHLGSLYEHLHDGSRSMLMTWDTRVQIAVGCAQALEYLHEECVPAIVHRGISSRAILLDDHMSPRIADAGLAVLNPTDAEAQTLSEQLVGGYAYNAPEYAMSGVYTAKSDVYSFGVVLLELLTGRKPVDPLEIRCIKLPAIQPPPSSAPYPTHPQTPPLVAFLPFPNASLSPELSPPLLRSKPKWESSLVRWAAPLFHDVVELERMVDPTLAGWAHTFTSSPSPILPPDSSLPQRQTQVGIITSALGGPSAARCGGARVHGGPNPCWANVPISPHFPYHHPFPPHYLQIQAQVGVFTGALGGPSAARCGGARAHGGPNPGWACA
ncbi:unnamed protein product [Closterium sp. Naga37s-1]|nr:unnamed protein product [Closterium sp. Naga37s-1]